jgi:hypothetical protein
MDELLTQLDNLEQQMLQNSETASHEQWTIFINDREQIINKIIACETVTPLTSEQKVKLTQIQFREEQLRRTMEQQKQEAAEWLRNRGQAKVQRNAYETAYASDSIIMDQRK